MGKLTVTVQDHQYNVHIGQDRTSYLRQTMLNF